MNVWDEPERGFYASSQVVEATGISWRQLDYWCRTGLIEGQPMCVGTGNQREWTAAQVDRVKEIRDALEEANGVLDRAGIPRRFSRG